MKHQYFFCMFFVIISTNSPSISSEQKDQHAHTEPKIENQLSKKTYAHHPTKQPGVIGLQENRVVVIPEQRTPVQHPAPKA